MFLKTINFLRRINPAFFVALIFFIIPFFWLKPGTMDLGGDGTRLYFYDPLNFIKNVSLYGIDPNGKGDIDPTKHAYLIYVGFIAIIKFLTGSSYLTIAVLNGIKLSVGFLSIYYIIKEFIQIEENKRIISKELAAITAGIFYVLFTGSQNLIFFWVRALHSHDQIFLNPLLFLLLMRYFLTKKNKYLLGILLITFIFSIDFAAISAPSFFAFYPLAFVFLLFYVVLVRKKKIPLKGFIVAGLLFLGMQAFHLLPEIATLFHKGSPVNAVVFTDIRDEVNFFIALRGFGKVSSNFLLPSPTVMFNFISIITPFVVLSGLLMKKEKKKEIFLTCIFFIFTLFLASANITNIGYVLYTKLFFIPGFSMFRHFYVQWEYIFIFFYAILFGQTLGIILARLKPFYLKLFTAIIFVAFVLSFSQFLDGELVNGLQWGSNHVRVALSMDPKYEQTLDFIRSLPSDGKVLILPLSENFNQVVFGTNDAAYLGPSSISFLTPKKSFAGYQILYPTPIPDDVMKFSKENKFESLIQLFSLLNIRYIYHDSDPKIYEKNFYNIFPYAFMLSSMPKTQSEYGEYINKLPVYSIYKNGPYRIFEFDQKVYRPEIYTPDSLYKGDMLDEISKNKVSYRSAFIDKKDCLKNGVIASVCSGQYIPSSADISVKKVNPAEYTIHITQSESKSPLLLIFQNSYDTGWKIYFNKKSFLSEDRHVLVNKYANGWIITSQDHDGKNDYTLSLVLDTQKYFWYGIIITAVSLIIFLIFAVFIFLSENKRDVNF